MMHAFFLPFESMNFNKSWV